MGIDALFLNANLATMSSSGPYGAIKDGALIVTGEKIRWVGKRSDLPAGAREEAAEIHDLGGWWVTPGLVDCHTHLVYGGNRAGEFELRLNGATYEEIARQGGGIRSTVAATRQADENSLYAQSLPRLQSLMAEGVTTVEIKSGYGLDLESEGRLLRVGRRLGREEPVRVFTTYLGAHALPPEFEGRADDYVDFICQEALPRLAGEGLADAVDAFCEGIGFSLSQTERIFQAAAAHHLPVKLHAEQFSDLGGSVLAARYKALSVDHLEHLGPLGVQAIAQAGTVAVLLPGAFYFLGEARKPPVDLLKKQGVPLAVASDSNPGSSPCGSLLLMVNMACTLFRLTPEEALAGVTRNGAAALGLADRLGTLEPGKAADFVAWDITEPAELAYHFGYNPVKMIVKEGRVISRR
ncbi:MAG: imidazolonepropionase [Deltaproteobacteria bacterium]|nr:imidazolonepropionase [Deltaproteobacteria bacterium]